MVTGICECPVGCDGSPCVHQYFLWSNSIAESSNFIPAFSEEKRQQFAKVALGFSLPLSYYEGLHSLPSPEHVHFQNNDENNENIEVDTMVNMLICLLNLVLFKENIH